MFNKPRGCLVTHSDPEGRKTIFDLIPKKFEKYISIGRLDYNSEGLLLITNNGDIKRYGNIDFDFDRWLLPAGDLPSVASRLALGSQGYY